jgi:DNA-binding IclR family transcriptional regulator
MDTPDSDKLVQTTETSLAIIDVLYELEEARIEQIANTLDIAPSTVYRHLQTLRVNKYVVKEGDFYRLGLQFLTVGGYIRDCSPEYDLAKIACKKLAEKTQERVQFEVEEQGERVFVHTTVGEQAVQADGTIGRRGPLHCSAAGKAMLASMSNKDIEEVIEEYGLEAVTKHTITNRETLLEEIESIREEGIAFNREESTIGLHAVASTVEMPNGELLGALSISGPAHRMDGERFRTEIPSIIRGAAQELELNIEYSKYV